MALKTKRKDSAREDHPSPSEVAEELGRILASPTFAAAERLCTFLRYAVEETLAGRAGRIKAYSIAVGAFGYDEAFDPQIDPYVRILARRLRRALSRYYAADGAAGPVRIEIPKGSYVPVFTRPGPSEPYAVGPSPAPGDPALAASANVGPSVAVLSFQDLGGGEELAHMATGLAEALVVELTRFTELRVVGPLQRAAADADPQVTALSYGAQFALFGSVTASGDAVRVTFRLSDTGDGRCVWAHRYDRVLPAKDLFGLMDELTLSVSSTIADSAGIITRTLMRRSTPWRSNQSSIYEAVLKAYHWAIVLTDEAYEEALRSLEQAVEQEPRSALARALLSDLYFSDWLSAIGSTPEALDRAEALAKEAIRLDDRREEAHWALGQVYFARRRQQRFHAEFARALALNPNRATTHGSYALFLAGMEEWDAAIRHAGKAWSLNPHHARWLHLVPFLHRYRTGDFDGALSSAFKLSTPGLLWEPLTRAAVLGSLGRSEEARPYLEQLLGMHPDFALRGEEYMGRLLWSPLNVSALLAGLEAAGIRGVPERSKFRSAADG